MNFGSDMLVFSGLPEDLIQVEERAKEQLKKSLPEDVFLRWIEPMHLEKITKDKILLHYYGTESLSVFRKRYRQIVWIQFCSVLGETKKMTVKKKAIPKIKEATTAPTTKKNLRVALLFGISFCLVAACLFFALVGTNFLLNRNFKENFYSVSSLKVTNPIRILQLSDLHTSTYGAENSRLLDRTKALKPDVILLTGDMLDSGAPDWNPTVTLCSRLAEIAPTYYIYGNNEVRRLYSMGLTQKALDEHFSFDDSNRDASALTSISDPFEEALEGVGVTVLKNEVATVTVGEEQVDVYGVLTSNPSSFWSYGGASFDAYRYENPDRLKITAFHEPLAMEEFTTDFWGDVTLAGHTHGGVAILPILGPLYTKEGGLLPQRQGLFAYGRYEVSGRPLIVSSGLTNESLWRINNPPEIVVVDITTF